MRYFVRRNLMTMKWDVLENDANGLFASLISSHDTEAEAQEAIRRFTPRATPSGEGRE